MMPSAYDLQYFVEVANTQNVSRAAERLGITQPSLTLAIKRLENVVGTALLFRSKRGVVPTQAGKQLLAQARFLLQEWEKIRSKAVESHSEVTGSFTIGCHPSVALYSLPDFLPNMLAEFPQLEVKLVHDLSRHVTESVASMKIDLGIVVNPVRHPDLVIKKLCDDEVTLWVGNGNRKTQNPSSDAVLLCEPDLLQTQDLLKKLKKNNIQYGRIVHSSNLEVITQLTASGAGIGILPGRVAARAKAPLQKIRTAPIFKDEICLVYRVENKDVKSIQMFVDRITTKIF